LEQITWQHAFLALIVLAAARLLSFGLRGVLRRVAERASTSAPCARDAPSGAPDDHATLCAALLDRLVPNL